MHRYVRHALARFLAGPGDDGYDAAEAVKCYDLRLAAERDPEVDRKYGPFYNARLVDAHDQLTVPDRLYDVREVGE